MTLVSWWVSTPDAPRLAPVFDRLLERRDAPALGIGQALGVRAGISLAAAYR